MCLGANNYLMKSLGNCVELLPSIPSSFFDVECYLPKPAGSKVRLGFGVKYVQYYRHLAAGTMQNCR